MPFFTGLPLNCVITLNCWPPIVHICLRWLHWSANPRVRNTFESSRPESFGLVAREGLSICTFIARNSCLFATMRCAFNLSFAGLRMHKQKNTSYCVSCFYSKTWVFNGARGGRGINLLAGRDIYRVASFSLVESENTLAGEDS